MKKAGLFAKRNGFTRDFSIPLTNEKGESIFVFEYSANELFAEQWDKIFVRLMEKDVREFDIGKLMFDMSVVEYDDTIDSNENGLLKHKVMCKFAKLIEPAFYIKAEDIKKK